jgi:hypothetical protein
LKGCDRKQSWCNVRYYPRIFPKGPSETVKKNLVIFLAENPVGFPVLYLSGLKEERKEKELHFKNVVFWIMFHVPIALGM